MKRMKMIPYNLYIYFEELSSFFKESESREEKFLRCGFAAVELSTFLLGDMIKNEGEINRGKVRHVLLDIEKQLELINSCNAFTQGIYFKDRFSENIENLKLLDQEFAGAVDRITLLYGEISKQVKIGFDGQINDIRTSFDLPEISMAAFESLDQKELPNVVEILRLEALEYFNSEDMLFMVTHQVSECWFNLGIAELESICELIDGSNVYDDRIEYHFRTVFEILLYLADHILILEHMVLADYHPLRVALRGASGGQSQQAYELFAVSRKSFDQFLALLKAQDKEIIKVLEKPRDNAALLSVVNHFSKLERSLKNFFFQHYVLSSSVIGSQSFGSIGYDLVTLVDKFVEPIFKEIDQAKYDFTLKTNFQYGSSSGILILEKEKTNLNREQKHTTNDEIIKTVIDNYFETISKFDQAAWVNLFDEDGYIEDPVGSRPYIGHQQLSVFFKGVLRFFSQLNMVIESIRAENDFTEVAWKAQATTYNGKAIAFNGKEIFQISDYGKIISAQVRWDPSVIANQLSKR